MHKPPFELNALNGENIYWSDRLTKRRNGLYLPVCQHLIAHGGWGNMDFQYLQLEKFMVWYNRYHIGKRTGFRAREDARLIEFSLQFNHTASYHAKPLPHQTVRNGQFNIFFLPYMDSSAAFEAGQLTTTLDIHFTTDFLITLSDHFPDLVIPFIDNIENKRAALIFKRPLYATGYMLSIAGNILEHLQQENPNYFLLEYDIQSLISYALVCKYEINSKNKKITLEQIARLRELTKLYVTDLTQKPDLRFMAKETNMSTTAFKDLFKGEMNTSVYHYFLSRRMNEAWHRVIDTFDPITQIAFEVGYSDVSNFSKAFKKFFKISPRDLRNKKNKKNDRMDNF